MRFDLFLDFPTLAPLFLFFSPQNAWEGKIMCLKIYTIVCEVPMTTVPHVRCQDCLFYLLVLLLLLDISLSVTSYKGENKPG